MVLALSGAQRGSRKALIGWLGATIACGIFFVGMQVYEFTHFVHRGLGFTTNLFGSSFYTLTGFHGTHVTIGVIWLSHSLDRCLARQAPAARSRSTWRWPRCTGTSSTWSGSSSSPSSTSSSEQGTMAAHVTATPARARHPTAGLYFKVGLVLFVLTALEVGLYEITYGEHAGSFAPTIKPLFVPMLLLLSAAKFALVAMFYMHLKQDSKLFTGVFVFPLIIAAFIIVALIVLQAYHFAFARSGNAGRTPSTDRLHTSGAWSLHPSVLIGTGILGALYFYGIGPSPPAHGYPPASRWQVLSFVAALLFWCWSLNGPVHDLSDYYLFSVHMVQHLVLTLLFPPLLLAGIPAWLLRPLLAPAGCAPVARFLTRPWLAAVLFSARSPSGTAVLLRSHDAEPRGAHRHPPDVHGDGHADVVAGHGSAAGASPAPDRAQHAVPVSGRDSDADRGGTDHVCGPGAVPLVRHRAAYLGAFAAGRSAAGRAI